jgi:phage shock protein PspC (stress-responsive transcriptional regulator)
VSITSTPTPAALDTGTPQADPPSTEPSGNSLAGARAWFARQGLSRPRQGRMLGGVAAAFARRYDVHPLVVRVAAIIGVVVVSPLIYVALWILMPKDPAAPASG